MTSRFSLTSPIETLRERFRFAGGMPYPPRYNIAPTQPVAIVRLRPGVEGTGERELALVRWGLIPGWVKDPREFATLVTARAETVVEKPSFKAAMRHRRCIVPADAFYEWTGKPKSKVPWLIRPRPGAALTPPLALAGLWENWLGSDGSEMETMALITVPANADLAEQHERMPAILMGDAIDAWLDVRGVDQVDAAELLRPAAENVLEKFEISLRLNAPGYDAADVQAPIGVTSR